MLECTDEAGWSAFVYASDPGLMLIVEGLDAVGADDDVLALGEDDRPSHDRRALFYVSRCSCYDWRQNRRMLVREHTSRGFSWSSVRQ